MSTEHIAAVFLGISSMVLLSRASVIARQTPAPDAPGHTILFVCEHGSAKSVIAAAHFNEMANKNGLPYQAIARGVHPDKQIPPFVRNGLATHGLNVSGWQPKRVSEEDVMSADRVITFGCTLPMPKSVTARKLKDWKDVPSPSENYQNASQAIAERVALLLKQLSGKQLSR